MPAEPDLSLLVLRVSDVDASRRFYEALGLTWQEERHGSGPTHHSCRLGATLLELYPAGSAASGRVRLGFAMSDPEGAAERAVAAGGVLRRTAQGSAGIVVRDPDGNDVELCPPSGREAVVAGAVLSHASICEMVRSYSSQPGSPPPFDVNGVIHLMLAALDNLRAHWIDADLEQIALSATPEQRRQLIEIGAFLRDHPEAAPEEE